MCVRVSSLLRCNGRIAIRYATTHAQPENTKGRLSKGTRHNTTYGSAQAREPITTPLIAQHKQESLPQHHLWLSTSKRAYHNTSSGSTHSQLIIDATQYFTGGSKRAVTILHDDASFVTLRCIYLISFLASYHKLKKVHLGEC